MSIDTEITGSPGQVEGAADWLRTRLAKKLEQASEKANKARRDADGSWNSHAGEEFGDMMSRARDSIDDLGSAARTMATDLDAFAAKLRTCQEEMADVRSTASGAGLTVTGFLVQDPGAGPARPPDDFLGTPEEVTAHNRRVAAYDAHQDLVRAYNAASREAARIDRSYGAACRSLQETYTPGQHAFWIVTGTDILGSSATGLVGLRATQQSALLTRAQGLVDEAAGLMREMQANPGQYVKRKWFFFRTLDETRLEADRLAIAGRLEEAGDLVDEARRLETGRGLRFLGGAGRVLGPLAGLVGVYNDYQDGETNTQIAVSQGVGFAAGAGATVATAAATGALIGSVVPGAGTVVGAGVGVVVGAGVAIFTDGAIDSLFENGPDVGAALDAGVDALGDTAGAIGSGIGSAVSTVGGWFD